MLIGLRTLSSVTTVNMMANTYHVLNHGFSRWQQPWSPIAQKLDPGCCYVRYDFSFRELVCGVASAHCNGAKHSSMSNSAWRDRMTHAKHEDIDGRLPGARHSPLTEQVCREAHQRSRTVQRARTTTTR